MAVDEGWIAYLNLEKKTLILGTLILMAKL